MRPTPPSTFVTKPRRPSLAYRSPSRGADASLLMSGCATDTACLALWTGGRWLKPCADDAMALEQETLHRHAAGPFKNDPGASKKVSTMPTSPAPYPHTRSRSRRR